MKGSARRLVLLGNLVVASGLAAVIVNCGGGERPKVSEEEPQPFPEGGTSSSSSSGGEAGPGGLVYAGLDENGEVSFGEGGFTNCGSTAPAQVISLKNNTNDVVNFTAKLGAGDKYFEIDKQEGGVPIKGQFAITVTPKPIPAESEVTPDLYSGRLDIVTKSGETKSIRLRQTARGAIIKTSLTTPQIDFGSVKANTTATQLVNFTNSGNAEANASFVLGTQVFGVDNGTAGSAKLGANATVPKTISFKPTDVQAYTDQVSISFDAATVHCKAPPASIALKGAGTSAVTVTPATLDFGPVDCGTAGAFRTVTVSSALAATFTPTLAGGSTKYTLADSNGTTVTAGNPIALTASVPYMLRVVPKSVPIPSSIANNALGDTLTITTTAPGDTPKNVDLRQTARGAILAISPTTITNSGSVNQIFNNALSVNNTGNAPADFTLAVTDLNPSPVHSGVLFSLNTTEGSAQVGALPVQFTVKVPDAPNRTQLASLQLGVKPGAVLCQALPGKYSVTAATGAATSITVNPASLNFGQVNCGTTATPQDLTITTIQNTSITPTLGGGANSPYTLTDGTGTALPQGQAIAITTGTPFTIRVVPKQIPATSSVANNAFGDTLTLTSSVDPPKSIALSETAKGVIFSFNPNKITGDDGLYNYALVNSGNTPGNYTISVTGASSSTLKTGTAQVGSLPGVLTKVGDGEMSVTSTAVLCADLPPAVLIKQTE